MSYIRKYLENAKNFANERYMNAIGFDYFAGGDQFFDADGDGGAAAPQAGGVPSMGAMRTSRPNVRSSLSPTNRISFRFSQHGRFTPARATYSRLHEAQSFRSHSVPSTFGIRRVPLPPGADRSSTPVMNHMRIQTSTGGCMSLLGIQT